MEEHRGITLMSSSYKVYATKLADRLRKEMEEKEIVPESQAGFREERGTVDNLYVLNYVVERQIGEREESSGGVHRSESGVDSVDRGLLGRCLEEGRVNKRLKERVMEIYEEMRCAVRVGEYYGRFWTARGVRQGYPLSPLLFNSFVVNL